MTIDYAAIARNALAALTDAGQAVTRRAYTAGAYDTATGVAANTTVDTTRTGALFDFSRGKEYERGQLIERSDKRLLLDATGPVAMTDHFIVNGVEYSVVSIGEVNPAGTCVLYDLHVR